METNEIIMQLLLGGLLGMAGQTVWGVVGLKKLNDTASQNQSSFKDSFETSKFFVSMLIGFVAGMLAMICVSPLTKDFKFSKEVLLGIAAAGYSGTDFIEGVIKKWLPGGNTDATQPQQIGAITQPIPKK